jgi:hypothetical protein
MAGGNRPRLLTLGVAGTGVLVGHWLTYLLSVPDGGARTATLRATGHAYLGIAGELTSAVLALSLVGVFLGALVDGGGAPRSPRSLTARLILLQVGAFAGMEVAERLFSGSPLGELMRGGIVPIGVVANAAIAVIGAAVLRRLLRLVERVADAAPRRSPTLPDLGRGIVAILAPSLPSLPEPAFAVAPARGPPLLPDCH